MMHKPPRINTVEVLQPKIDYDIRSVWLAEEEVDAQRISIDIAAHSRMLEPILTRFGDYLRSIPLHPPQIPFVSNLTGTFITAEEATDPDYWVGHLRNTVYFANCIATRAQTPERVFLGIGPGRALTSLTQAHGSVAANQIVSSLLHPDHKIGDMVGLR